MLREISIFTGSDDVRLALDLLRQAASCEARGGDHPAELERLGGYFCSQRGHDELLSLAARLSVNPSDVPTAEETQRMFAGAATCTAPARRASGIGCGCRSETR